jgi:hypothetical protein
MLWDVSSSLYQDWDKKMRLSGAIMLNLSYWIHCPQDTVFRANEVFVSGAPLRERLVQNKKHVDVIWG